MKKYLIILMLIVSTLLLVSCDSGDLSGTSVDTVTPITEKPQQTYIEDIKLCGAYWDRYSTNASGRVNSYYSTSENGRDYKKVKDVNLNRDCGTTTDCIYLYETLTYDRDHAITNIIAVTSDKELSATFYYDTDAQVGYTAVAGIRVNGLATSTTHRNVFDLNMGAGGKYIYLYVTTDTKYDPITDIDISHGITNVLSGYSIVSNASTKAVQDLNEGAGGANLFLSFSRNVTGYEIYKFTVTDFTEKGAYTYKTYDIKGTDPYLKAEHLVPIVEKNEYAHFCGYFYSTNYNKVEVGDLASFYHLSVEAFWLYDLVFDMSKFELENVTYESVSRFNYVPSVPEIKGFTVTGWHFQGETENVKLYSSLTRGGILEPTIKYIFEDDFDQFLEGYQLAKMYRDSSNDYKAVAATMLKNTQKGSNYKLAFLSILNTLGYDYNSETESVFEIEAKTLINTTLDYQDLSDDEKYKIEALRYFLVSCSDSQVNYAITYYNSLNTDSFFDAVMLDLCNNELARRH